MHVTIRVAVNVPDKARPRTVLLVSPDGEWRDAAEQALTLAGYRVIPARHGGQAIVESTRYGSVDVIVGEGEFGGGSLPGRIFDDHPEARVLHFRTRPATREALLASVAAALE